jgi:hypothetical protein
MSTAKPLSSGSPSESQRFTLPVMSSRAASINGLLFSSSGGVRGAPGVSGFHVLVQSATSSMVFGTTMTTEPASTPSSMLSILGVGDTAKITPRVQKHSKVLSVFSFSLVPSDNSTSCLLRSAEVALRPRASSMMEFRTTRERGTNRVAASASCRSLHVRCKSTSAASNDARSEPSFRMRYLLDIRAALQVSTVSRFFISLHLPQTRLPEFSTCCPKYNVGAQLLRSARITSSSHASVPAEPLLSVCASSA